VHKSRKKEINASWNQNGAWMNHMQSKFTRHTPWLWKGALTSFPIIYFVTNDEGYITMGKNDENFQFDQVMNLVTMCIHYSKYKFLLRSF
jgi:hypothetical protein